MRPSSLTFITAITMVLLIACGQDNLESKKLELEEKRKELAATQAEITKLEKEIAELDTTISTAHLIPVEVKELSFEPFTHSFRVSGTLEAENNLSISPEASGQVKNVLVKEGDRVSRGQVLATLNTSTIESNIAEVQTSLDLANTLYEKQKRLWDQKVGSEMQYLEAKNRKESLENRLATLRSQLSLSIVRAPVDGVVDNIFKREGELVMPGTPLLQLVNLSEMKIKADVSESYLSSVKVGDMVTLTFPSLGQDSIKAPISRISNIINLKNRSFAVEVKLPNRNGLLKPNAIGMMEITDYSNDSSLVVPSSAISKDSNGDYVYVAKNRDGKIVASKTRVTAGRSSSGSTRVLSGLKPGDKVIVKGYNEVAEGNQVDIKTTSN